MNLILRAVLIYLLNKRCIGGKHIPEDLLKSKTKWAKPEEVKEFKKEYCRLVQEGYVIKLKKRTGKGSGWHISLNPRKLKEVYEMIR